MKIMYDVQILEIRDWPDGRALLMTRDEGLKRRILRAADSEDNGTPPAVELMTDPDVVYAPEDTEGLMLAVVSRQRVGLVLDLEEMTFGLGLSVEEAAQ